MTGSVFCVLVLVSLVPGALLMCFEPDYQTNHYHVEKYTSAPIILVGKVNRTKQNRTHQAVELTVTCVYKAPDQTTMHGVKNLLPQTINFLMEHSAVCKPLLIPGRSYFLFFDRKRLTKKQKRREKKKSVHETFESSTSPIPVPEMDKDYLERLVSVVKDHNPVGYCYNVWSKWSTCSTRCGVGYMNRTYHRHNKPSLNQLAVCHNAPCTQTNSIYTTSDEYHYQSINIDNCKSLELVRVRWCTGLSPDLFVRIAISWEIRPILMLCNTNNHETLQYHNVAIPSECGLRPKQLQ